MKYIKILIAISFVFFAYKLINANDRINYKLPNKKDNLTIFIFIKDSDIFEDIASHLNDNIKSVYSDYIKDVNFKRDVRFLEKNKNHLAFDKKGVDYSRLLKSDNIAHLNYSIGNMIEFYFLNEKSKLKKQNYHLINFLNRLNQYIKDQFAAANRISRDIGIKDFVIGSEYIPYSNRLVDDKFYIMRVEFLDFNSMDKYLDTGVDSILTMILDENTALFNSDIFLHLPYSNKSKYSNQNYRINQYIDQVSSFEDLTNIYDELLEREDVIFIESIFDYFFDASKGIDLQLENIYKDFNYESYHNSLLHLEEKLITLQFYHSCNSESSSICDILFDLLGNEDLNNKGLLSNYINMINDDMIYIIDNMNFTGMKDLKLINSNSKYPDKKFSLHDISRDVKNYLVEDGLFKIRYFIK